MQRPKIYVDGQHGTTGLEIHTLLGERDDIELLAIDHGDRRDDRARRQRMGEADLVILCLPDDASRQAVTMLDGRSRVLDASTAHRTDPGWVYGLPELTPLQRERIRSAARVANPGCYPTGYLLGVRPLVDAGIVSPAAQLTCHGLSGYSGGGRALIERFRHEHRPYSWAARPYGLDLRHKHVPEMHQFAGTDQAPLFLPVVCDYERGMIIEVGLGRNDLTPGTGAHEVRAALRARYRTEPAVLVRDGRELIAEDPYLSPEAMNHTIGVELAIFADAETHPRHVLVVARLDNLGKGAAGAAVQNMNLMLGFDEFTGLVLPECR